VTRIGQKNGLISFAR